MKNFTIKIAKTCNVINVREKKNIMLMWGVKCEVWSEKFKM